MRDKFNILKKKLDIKGFLIINYVITILILYIIIKLADSSSAFIVKNFIFKNQITNYPNLYSMYDKDFSKINIGVLEQIGGWVEILDQNNKVIYVKGHKKDKIMQYSESQLLQLTSPPEEPYSKTNSYIGCITEVKGKNNEPYIFILKIDKRKVESSLLYKPSLTDKNDIPIILKSYGVEYFFKFLYLLVGLYIYSRISSKFITNPLKTFINSMKKIKKMDYGTRTNINGLKELQDVENEFNEMAVKLQDVKEDNKRIDESKKRLLVDVSHDLKTPITSIQGYSKLLLEEDISDSDKKKFLNIVYNKSVYAALLIEDLFELSKLEDSQYNISFEAHNLSEWLRRLIAEYYEEFISKGFNLKINISEKPVIFKFDEKLMRRAIVNILNNSLKYNKSGTTEQISCFLENKIIYLKIGNNGEEIEKSIRNKIFEPFVKSECREFEGTGIGLAITKKIIERHGGNITLTYEKNMNNVFNILLPLKF